MPHKFEGWVWIVLMRVPLLLLVWRQSKLKRIYAAHCFCYPLEIAALALQSRWSKVADDCKNEVVQIMSNQLVTLLARVASFEDSLRKIIIVVDKRIYSIWRSAQSHVSLLECSYIYSSIFP